MAEMKQYLGGQIFGKPTLPDVDLSDKVIVVTGANTGLGLESAKHLYVRNTQLWKAVSDSISSVNLNAATIILGCRDMEKGEAAKKAIITSSGFASITTVEVWHVDLSNYDSVLSFGHRVQTKLPRLDGFVANAGIETTKFEIAEGCESTLTVNVISTFVLAILVLPKLQETAKTHDTLTNLTVVGSMQQVFAPANQLQVPTQSDIFEALSHVETADMGGRYALSKLMVQICSRELAQRISASTNGMSNQIVVNCVNPGWCDTDLSRHGPRGLMAGSVFKLIGRSAEAGSRTLVHAVTAGQITHGRYLSECQIKNESEFVHSSEGQKSQEKLWKDLSDTIEGISPGAMAIVG
jgi:retinol dehydrogenase 12